jgi:hypothetical protein
VHTHISRCYGESLVKKTEVKDGMEAGAQRITKITTLEMYLYSIITAFCKTFISIEFAEHCDPFRLNWCYKFGICIVVGLNGTPVDAKIRPSRQVAMYN